MSVGDESRVSVAGVNAPYRLLAVLSALVLTGTYVSILYHITDVVGSVTRLVAVLAATLLLGTLLARLLTLRSALALASVLLGLGLTGYLFSVPDAQITPGTMRLLLSDVFALLTGLSALRMTNVTVWALAMAPGPVFLTWYLTLRRRYTLAALAGGTMVLFFVLTGDAGTVVTLAGMVGAAGTVGFGAMERRGGTWEQLDALAIVLVAMVVVSMTVSVVPGGSASPAAPANRGAGSGTMEGNLMSSGERVDIVGSIELSPKVRFTVSADEPSYWRTAAYDRYTGGDWIRTGGARPYSGPLAPPDGTSTEVVQTVRAESDMEVLPAAWRPVEVGPNVANRAEVTDTGSIQPRGRIAEGETYSVRSQVPDPNAHELRTAGTTYPSHVTERYLQLPASTPDRVGARAAEITADADTPYEKAVAVEAWLEENKAYSLNVERPDGDIADAFIFEMDRGYCTYYATAMTAMLRSEGVPARFVTGYTTGQQVAEDQWVVRGLNSHAWVEVYFPEVGWVPFDPTPPDPRGADEDSTLAQARAAGIENVDTNQSRQGSWTPDGTPAESDRQTDSLAEANATETSAAEQQWRRPRFDELEPGLDGAAAIETPTETPPTPEPEDEGEDEAGGVPFAPPTRAQAALVLILFAGLVAGAHRSGSLERAYRELWLRRQGARRTPREDVRRAYDRLEYLLGRQYRSRRPGETPRAYLAALDAAGMDDRARRVGRTYERARYGGGVDRAEADEAVELVDDIVADHASVRARVARRLRRR